MSEIIEVQARKTLQNITPYPPGKPIWELQSEQGLSKVVKLASNENPLGPSPKALEAIVCSLSDIHRYPDSSTSNLRQLIAVKLGMGADNFIISNGGDELITLVSEAFLEPGDEIIVPSPSFSEYEFGAHLMGANIVTVPLGEIYSFDIDAIVNAVTEQTKMICICSPNNPTGTYLSKSVLHHLLDVLPKHILVLFDAAYSQYADADDYTDGLEFVRAGYPIVVLQTFSKIYGLAGLRVGFGAAPESIIQQILKVKEPFNVNTLAQAAAAAALHDVEHVHLSLQINRQGKNQLYLSFRELRLPFIESMSNFVLVELGPDAKSIYEQLLTKGIIVRYGGLWKLPHHIRVSVGTEEENSTFIQRLSEILKLT
ncbi:histidinol-phosphate transaminase [Paenibacillus alginolyticus]|uniref:Histidinol-phosphate aminotransferase n=1 Tax=Paenibacillus alginolyticus TaxID=59839 RepID=A0ABT4GHQ5_9BACL|nr:histidinol-phosphate transaminase [Paenibacillus alginolyticus]MCY9670288.1 histidinol-phosphate transaminase [Paenibacillus alginolyticus]MCY9695589.1 histidinol-phosphate transaminase [Paenibacillus alginolyticus]MEC0148245.1 histidinol-phosphate transaminase [Paenibacillus alginolyticus]